MLSIDPSQLSIKDRHHHLLNGIGPRPIAWVSTINEKGEPNLAPFSFFNIFSTNPPVLAFSPARRGRDNTTKHTFENIKKHAECVVNIVNYALLNQMVLSSQEYPEGVSELDMAGLESAKSEVVSPPRVADSPMQLECKVIEINELGTEGSAGNLILAEVVRIHIREEVIGESGFIDQSKIDLVGRMGENWYSRAHGDSIFQVRSNVTVKGIGFPALPEDIRDSKVLTGNDLGKLAMMDALPDETSVNEYKLTELSEIFIELEDDSEELKTRLHHIAKDALAEHRIEDAWKTLLAYND